MHNGILSDGCIGRRRRCMPTRNVLAAIELITSLFPRCSHSFVHTLLGQEANETGAIAPSEAETTVGEPSGRAFVVGLKQRFQRAANADGRLHRRARFRVSRIAEKQILRADHRFHETVIRFGLFFGLKLLDRAANPIFVNRRNKTDVQ